MLYQLSYSREKIPTEWWGRVDLNHRRLMPTGLQPVPFDRSGTPPNNRLNPGQGLNAESGYNNVRERLVLAMGLEPATDGLQNRCSTN